MLKQLFILLFRLITQSTSAWVELSGMQDKDNEHFYKSYLFPVFGIIALLSFAGILISVQTMVFQLALKVVIKQIIIYGGSFYLTSFLLSEFIFPRYELAKDRLLTERFTGYASALIYGVAMVKSLFPSLFFLEIIVFFTIYIIWTGAVSFLQIKEDRIVKFTIFAGCFILLTPFLISFLIDMLMPGMKM